MPLLPINKQLLESIWRGDISGVRSALAGGADPNVATADPLTFKDPYFAHNHKASTLFHVICSTPNLDIFELLLSRGVDPNQTYTGATVIQYIAQQSYPSYGDKSPKRFAGKILFKPRFPLVHSGETMIGWVHALIWVDRTRSDPQLLKIIALLSPEVREYWALEDKQAEKDRQAEIQRQAEIVRQAEIARQQAEQQAKFARQRTALIVQEESVRKDIKAIFATTLTAQQTEFAERQAEIVRQAKIARQQAEQQAKFAGKRTALIVQEESVRKDIEAIFATTLTAQQTEFAEHHAELSKLLEISKKRAADIRRFRTPNVRERTRIQARHATAGFDTANPLFHRHPKYHAAAGIARMWRFDWDMGVGLHTVSTRFDFGEYFKAGYYTSRHACSACRSSYVTDTNGMKQEPCGHFFHEECLAAFQTEGTQFATICPLCQHENKKYIKAQSASDVELIRAIIKNDIFRVRHALTAGADPNTGLGYATDVVFMWLQSRRIIIWAPGSRPILNAIPMLELIHRAIAARPAELAKQKRLAEEAKQFFWTEGSRLIAFIQNYIHSAIIAELDALERLYCIFKSDQVFPRYTGFVNQNLLDAVYEFITVYTDKDPFLHIKADLARQIFERIIALRSAKRSMSLAKILRIKIGELDTWDACVASLTKRPGDTPDTNPLAFRALRDPAAVRHQTTALIPLPGDPFGKSAPTTRFGIGIRLFVSSEGGKLKHPPEQRMYPQSIKEHYSKHQSTTAVYFDPIDPSKNVLPELLPWYTDLRSGILLPYSTEFALLNRAFVRDADTYNRAYDTLGYEPANFMFPSVESCIDYVRTQGTQDRYTEILARLRWATQPSGTGALIPTGQSLPHITRDPCLLIHADSNPAVFRLSVVLSWVFPHIWTKLAMKIKLLKCINNKS